VSPAHASPAWGRGGDAEASARAAIVEALAVLFVEALDHEDAAAMEGAPSAQPALQRGHEGRAIQGQRSGSDQNDDGHHVISDDVSAGR
jgi:hypothetical protein